MPTEVTSTGSEASSEAITHACDWRLLETADGSWTLVHPLHGQACHSRSGAWLEARERHAQACELRERAACAGTRELALLDVGTGVGLNLAAAFQAVSASALRLRVVSLELERAVIERTLADFGRSAGGPSAGPGEVWHRPLRSALDLALRTRGGPRLPVESPGQRLLGTLELWLGDARDSLRALPPETRFDAVFLDPFSPGVDPALWSPAFLAAVARRMAPGSMLSTYSASLGVRAGLAAAGLRVGPGAAVGSKAQGTLASPDRALGAFDSRTRRRIERRAEALRTALEGDRESGLGAGADLVLE